MAKTMIDNNNGEEDFKYIQGHRYIDNPKYVLNKLESLSKKENFYRVRATRISKEDSSLIDEFPSPEYQCDIDGKTYYFSPLSIPYNGEPLDVLIEKKGETLFLRGAVYWDEGELRSNYAEGIKFYSKNKLRINFIEKQKKKSEIKDLLLRYQVLLDKETKVILLLFGVFVLAILLIFTA